MRSPALLVFCVEVHESFRGSFHRFHGSFHGKKIPEASTDGSSFHESFHESFHGSSGRCHGSHFHGSFHGNFHRSFHERFHESFTKACTEASTKAFTEASTKATEVLPRKFPRIRKLPRKHFHGFLGFSSMKASGRRTEGWKLSGFHENFHESFHENFFVRAFDVASTKSWKLHPRNCAFYFHGNFRSFHGISAASTTAPTDIFVFYTTVPPVELTAFSTTWLTHTMYETKRVSPYNGCCVSLC